MTIVDAHLDLSYNALSGRDVLRPAVEQTPGEFVPTVGLPDLAAGGVAMVCATVFTEPSVNGSAGYTDAEGAYAQGQRHLAWYRQRAADGSFRVVKSKSDLDDLRSGRREPVGRTALTADGLAAAAPKSLAAVLLMEGADPLRTVDDLGEWFEFGLRVVGLAWRGTRFAGGTGQPGPLTPAGVGMVAALDRLGIVHDASHLAEESFWELMDRSAGPVMASHSNCRAIVPTDRQLSDEMIRAIAARGGVVGINFFDKFLLPPDQIGKRRATLEDVVRHVDHVAQLTGSARYVGIGTDMDGGLGRDQIPVEITTSADLYKTAEALRRRGYSEADVAGVMGDHWVEFFARVLPG